MANKMKRPREETPKPKPNDDGARGKRLKQWGSGILIFAFATQQFLVVHYIGKLEDYFKSYQAYSNAYNSALLYENLYFSQAVATNKADGNVLKKAAVDNIYGFSVRILNSSLSKPEKERKIAALFEAANKVHDLDSYNGYKNVLNKEEGDYLKETQDDFARLNTLKDIATWVYLGIYFVGSVLLIRAIKYE